MRKVAGALFAVAIVLPVGLMASPSGAVGGTSCKTVSGAAAFSPALPKLGNATMVLSTVTAKGAKVGGCVGGGVKSASASLTAKFSKPGNCTTLAQAGSTNPTKGKGTWTWNSTKKSTIALTLTGVKGAPTHAKLAGTVTAGLFKGLKLSGLVAYAIPAGACTKTALTKVTFKQLSPLVIK
jgi:hypothetical protein